MCLLHLEWVDDYHLAVTKCTIMQIIENNTGKT